MGYARRTGVPITFRAAGTSSMQLGFDVLTRREQRHWLAHPGPYLALAIALCIFAPHAARRIGRNHFTART